MVHRLIGCLAAFSLASATTAFTAGKIQTIYATNPRLEYQPSTSCAPSGPFGGCRLYSPWETEKYIGLGANEIIMHTSSWGNEPTLPDQIRKIVLGFRGTSISIYGAPKSKLVHPPGRQQVCLDDHCVELNAAGLYDNAPPIQDNQPVLLWTRLSLRENRYHKLELRLLDGPGGETTGMTLHHVNVDETPFQSSPYQLEIDEELVNATYHDTHPAIFYTPQRAPGGGSDFNPWDFVVYSGNHGQNASYHHTSNWAHTIDEQHTRGLSFTAKGTHISIYGAPSRVIQDSHAKQEVCIDEVCIDEVCHAIDVARAYLNILDEDIGKPVLLWSTHGLDPRNEHHVSVRLLELDSPLGSIRHMTFTKVVVTEIRKKRLGQYPKPGKDGHRVTIYHDDPSVVYSPRPSTIGYNPWDIETYPGRSGTNESFIRTSSWQNQPFGSGNRNIALSFNGTQISLYGAPRSRIVHSHGKQQVCLDGTTCALIDVARAYLNVDPGVEHLPVLMWSSDAHPFQLVDHGNHRLVFRLVEAAEDDAFGVIRGLTFSHAVCSWDEKSSPSTTSTAVSTLPPERKTIYTTKTNTASITSTEIQHVTLTRTTTVIRTTDPLPPSGPQGPGREPSGLNPLTTIILLLAVIIVGMIKFLNPNPRIPGPLAAEGEAQPLLPDRPPSPSPSIPPAGQQLQPHPDDGLRPRQPDGTTVDPPPYSGPYGAFNGTQRGHSTTQDTSNSIQGYRTGTASSNSAGVGPGLSGPHTQAFPPVGPMQVVGVDRSGSAPGNPATRGRHWRRHREVNRTRP